MITLQQLSDLRAAREVVLSGKSETGGIWKYYHDVVEIFPALADTIERLVEFVREVDQNDRCSLEIRDAAFALLAELDASKSGGV